MTYDINIMGSPSDRVTDLRMDNTALTGIQKLVQKTLILLFTDNTDPVNLGLGTDLTPNLLGANADTEIVRNLFNIALAQVMDNIRQQTPADAPAEEKLLGYDVLINKTVRDTAIVEITVRSQSGVSYIVRVPVKHIAV